MGNVETCVTTEAFVVSLISCYRERNPEQTIFQLCTADEIFEQGRKLGFLEEMDILNAKRFIERRNVARVGHEFACIVLNERDETDWKAVQSLRDLYDCRVCAKHIAQVCLKGIMEPKEEKRFQLLLGITEKEMRDIVERIVNVTKRIPMK